MSRIVSVAIGNSTREFDKEYHYIVPDALKDAVVPGVRVIVPFGGADRSREAYVLGFVEKTEITSGLKEIKEAIDKNPILDESMIRLAGWMRERYACTWSDAFRCMLPAGIGVKSLRMVRLVRNGAAPAEEGRDEIAGAGDKMAGAEDKMAGAMDKETAARDKTAGVMNKIIGILAENGNECEYGELRKLVGAASFSKSVKQLEQRGIIEVREKYSAGLKEKTARAVYLAAPVEEVAGEIENNRIKKIQQIRVLEMLMEYEYIPVADIVRFAGVSAGVLDTLAKHGYIGYMDVEINRDPLKDVLVPRTEPLKPTPGQEKVLKEIVGLMDGGKFAEVLLHGITGSGKTEVYLQVIRHAADMGKQAIVLVPEISLTPQMADRFKGRFGEDVAVLHSRLSPGERFDQWRMIKDGRINVVVGARSAVFAPVKRLGVIIIDEEHENSYKSEITPRYHAAGIARRRCMDADAVLLYGSATPSVETFCKAETGAIGFVQLAERANMAVLPEVHLVDMRKELDEGNRSVFSRKLKEEIEKNIASGRQTILFLNRRGYASFVLCRSCGYTAKCVNCNISLTYHSYDGRLICHYCGYTIRLPSTCPRCKSNYLRQFGTGTQKIEDDLKRQFPGCSAIRMDMDTTACKNSHREILSAFREKNINILIGTQMIAKGHDFPNVTLVGVLAADSMLNLDDYRASERTFQLLTQVAGRAGRGELPGRVVIQTYNTEDFSINAACRHDYLSFYKQEIKIREKLCYPPFACIAVAILSGADDRAVSAGAEEARELMLTAFSESGIKADLLGPARSPLTKIKNKYRWRIIIKCGDEDALAAALAKVSDGFRKKHARDGVEMCLDINPVNML